MKRVVLLENVDLDILEGNIWEKGETKRKYIDLHDILDIKVDKYGTGNVRNVYFDGEPKSNSWYYKNVQYAKLYIDMNTNELISHDLPEDLQQIVVEKYHERQSKEEPEEPINKEIIEALPERFEQLTLDSEDNKAQFLSQKVKYKKSKDFDDTGEWITTIDGEEYKIYKNMNTGWWNITSESAKKLKLEDSYGSTHMGFTKKDATSKLLEQIWENRSSISKILEKLKEKVMNTIEKAEEKAAQIIEQQMSLLISNSTKLKDGVSSDINVTQNAQNMYNNNILMETLKQLKSGIEEGRDPIEEIRRDITFLEEGIKLDVLIKRMKSAENDLKSTTSGMFIRRLPMELLEIIGQTYTIQVLKQILEKAQK